MYIVLLNVIHVSSDDVVLKYVSSSNLLLLVFTEVGMRYALLVRIRRWYLSFPSNYSLETKFVGTWWCACMWLCNLDILHFGLQFWKLYLEHNWYSDILKRHSCLLCKSWSQKLLAKDWHLKNRVSIWSALHFIIKPVPAETYSTVINSCG